MVWCREMILQSILRTLIIWKCKSIAKNIAIYSSEQVCYRLTHFTTRRSMTQLSIPTKHDYIEDVVCEEKDIVDNEMKVFPLGKNDTKVLLIKQKGQIYALGNKCTHYGAPLHTGALGNGKVRCPWHGACFNIKTGDIEDFPGMDSLPCYKVSIDENGGVRVRAKVKDLELSKRVNDMCPYDTKNLLSIIIVGGGPAAAVCAQSLRQEGFNGKITVLTEERIVPYDRVKVSKVMNLDIERFLLRPPSFYEDHNIETRIGFRAIRLNTDENTVTLRNNEKLYYNYLFICTGSKARIPDLPGVDLRNIFVLRNYTDALSINAALNKEKHLIIYGQGFIGVEAAAYCVDKCASVTIIGRADVPLQQVFGDQIGARIKQELESKGVTFIKNTIAQFLPNENINDLVGKVQLSDNTTLPSDICILGLGTTFSTEWLNDSSIQMLEDGSIPVDEYLRTNISNVFAGGDIAYAQILGNKDFKATIGHFGLAQYHGKIAALNICGKPTSLHSVPYFWTTFFGKSFRYAGYGKPDNVIIHGSLEDLSFFAYYLQDGKVIAMSSCGADPVVSEYANLLAEGKSLTEDDVKTNPLGWLSKKTKEAMKKLVEK